MRAVTPLLTVLGLALALPNLAGHALAEDGPPKLNIEKTCQSAATADNSLNNKSSKEGCLSSERDAENDLKRHWDTFPVAAKKQCAAQFEAGGYPSYVETLTCLELASDTGPKKPAGRADANGTGKTGKMNAEPPASQRTDPIEVLRDKNE